MANRTGESAPIVRIFLSSPSDVEDERKIARELIEGQLQKSVAHRHLKLEVIAWDDPNAHIPMLANKTPQESVNRELPRPSTCDIVIVILWARMGTPLPETILKPNRERFLSGTEWEHWDAIHSTWEPKPDVLVYRRTEAPMIDARDRKLAAETWEQLDRVDAFFAQFRNADGSLAASVNEYATSDALKELLRQHLERLLHRRAPAGGGEQRTIAATIPEAYLDWLREKCADVSLLGQEKQQGQALTLDHVYVPALTSPPAEPPAPAAGKRRRQKQPDETAERKPVPLLQRLDAESLYVPAPAGAGKSTFCRWAVLQGIAAADLAHLVPAPKEFAETAPAKLCGRLPLLVPLRDFHEEIDGGRGRCTSHRRELEDAMTAWVDRTLKDRLTGENLVAHLKAGSAFLLLDGLDEVPVSDTRDGATVFPRDLLLSGLADALPTWLKAGNRILLTSRPYGLDEEGLRKLGLPQAPLEPLPEPLQDLFIARWFHALGKPEQEAKGLIAAIRERDDLGPLAENPMMLTALCVLWDSGGRLPEDRYELYRRIVNNVLFHRFRDEVRQREPARARLEAIAHGMHVGDRDDPRDSPAAEISHHEIDRILRKFADDNPYNERGRIEPVAQREELLTRSGLLLPRAGDRAVFYHLSVQEFLAAERILNTEEDLLPVFRACSVEASWRPTLLFLFAGKMVRPSPWGFRLLSQLLTEQNRDAVKGNPAPAVFIAEALDLCLAKNYAVPAELKGSFCRLVQDAIEDEVELQARHALGLTLGRVGDPRIFDARDPRAYVEVPAGTYPYSDQGRTVEIAAPFWIGRYPVTNQQFAAFIDNRGYDEQQWWSEKGWEWRKDISQPVPQWWEDRQFNAPNQPVVGVTYWEAEACSKWAGGRLPTELEWECAARGEKALQFPWGNSWEDYICNTCEVGLGASSPVGIFPRSKQETRGIEDMVGNVTEWCNNVYDPSQDDDRFVVRGGGWNLERSVADTIYRLGCWRHVPLPNIGFRVVRFFSSSGINR